MAYTIALLGRPHDNEYHVLDMLRDGIACDNRFRVQSWRVGRYVSTREDRKTYRAAPIMYAIYLKGVRLIFKKPYCGQHFSACPVGSRKIMATYLEREDWIKFHDLVNKILTDHQVRALVWTVPRETKARRMWVRQDMQARVKWDFEMVGDGGRFREVWNTGTPDQFIV